MIRFTPLRWALPLVVVCGLAAGCHALFGRSPWGDEPTGDAREAGGPSCDVCHAEVAKRHLDGPHGGEGIACGQCHRGGGHPAFDEPLDDGTCGGCHLPEYQQVAPSAHARNAIVVPVEISERTLRADGFRIELSERVFFTTRDQRSRRGGRLCAGCHYDGHRLSSSSARSAHLRESCHTDRGGHYSDVVADDNRCLVCHMREGVTVVGQAVTSHAFPGLAEPGR